MDNAILSNLLSLNTLEIELAWLSGKPTKLNILEAQEDNIFVVVKIGH